MRLVFDTNVVISTLVLKSQHTLFIRQAWAKHELIPIITKITIEEILRVLQYPKFKLSHTEQEDLLEEYLEYAEVCIEIQSVKDHYTCTDIHDQKFLDLAISARAEGIITGDWDLLTITKCFPIPILSIRDLQALLNKGRY